VFALRKPKISGLGDALQKIIKLTVKKTIEERKRPEDDINALFGVGMLRMA
jgi:hypothetical protein